MSIMWHFMRIAAASLIFTTTTSAAVQASSACTRICKVEACLGSSLSSNASISASSSASPRWSDFDAPSPGLVVNVGIEHDVLLVVQCCLEAKVPFFAQGGGNAWAETFHLARNGVTINLRGLNHITFSKDKTQATFQGGAIIEEVVNAAYANGARIPTGNCNCVGTLGAILGGGVGRLMGLYGFGVDNLLSLNIVTAYGVAVTVTPQNLPDLWWALRGAGANFGIVTSAVIKSYPVPTAQNGAWTGDLFFTEDKIEAIVSAINSLVLKPEMAIFLYYISPGTPTVVVSPYYLGNSTSGMAAFSSILSLGPVVDTTVWTPYNETNAGSDAFCVKGGRKPTFGAGLAQMDPATWRAIWNAFVVFTENPAFGSSAVLVEAYSMAKARTFSASSSAYPFRDTVNYQAAVIPWYTNASLDVEALAFGSKVRDLWRSTDGLLQNSTYINFAFNDPLPTVYGDSLTKLKILKEIYDPTNQFNQFFSI